MLYSFWSTISHQKHDVFLSFRGEDTRHGLAEELHLALLEARIPTYRDDANVENWKRDSVGAAERRSNVECRHHIILQILVLR